MTSIAVQTPAPPEMPNHAWPTSTPHEYQSIRRGVGFAAAMTIPLVVVTLDNVDTLNVTLLPEQSMRATRE